jgi:hypothetical protein
LATLFVVMMTTALMGQIVETGVITGVVRDNTRAVVPGAKVTIHNIATTLNEKTASDGAGLWVSQPLTPGDYTVEIEVSGFSKVVNRVRLEVGQRVNADSVLAVGQTSETVTVDATAGSLLETESSDVGSLRTEEEVKDLPLNGRNFAGLIGLGAGVMPAYTQVTSSVPYTVQRGVSEYVIDGLRYQDNRILLDGIGDNENHNGLGVVIFPPIDALQEFKEEQSNSDARYGRTLSGTTNVAYKSGGSEYHGEAFEFFRNSALDARNYYATPGFAKPALRLNNFGVLLSGPLFGKKNPKTFFFADYAGQRLAQGLPFTDTVPNFTLANGYYNFSRYTNTIKNPTTGKVYAGNLVPVSDLPGGGTGPGANILALYQKYASPNVSASGYNFFNEPVRTDDENAFDVKVDHQFSDKDNGFLRFSYSHGSLVMPGPLPNPLVGSTISGPAVNPAYQVALNETHVFSPTTINTARFGWTRLFTIAKNFNYGSDISEQLGINGVDHPGEPNSYGLPVFTISGFTAIGDAANSPTQIGTNNYQYDDNLNLVRGKHSIDIGGEFGKLQYNILQTVAEHGTMAFNNGASAYTGFALTDLLFQAPKSGTYAYQAGTRGFRQTDVALYAQDNWKTTSKLTLNLGVRYENYLGWPWNEAHNKMYQFDPSLSTTSVFQVGTNGISGSGVSGNNTNFMPRIGLSYQLTPKTVFNAGYGIYYGVPNISNSSGLSANAPGEDYWSFNNAVPYTNAGFHTLSEGFVHTVAVANGNTFTPTIANYYPLYTVDPHAKTPYSEQWHASIQREILPSTTITVAYVGNVGVHLDGFTDINANKSGLSNVSTNRPYPNFAQINQLQTRDISNYNAVQITAERRAGNLSFNVNYTYSHALDEGSTNGVVATDPYNRHYDYGNADTDVPNRFVASVNYKLPFKSSGHLKQVVEGWQVNTIAQLYDGLPFSFTAGAVGDGITNRANVGAAACAGVATSTYKGNVYCVPAAGDWGNTGRNSLRGPGTKTVDFSVFKHFELAKAKTLELRSEFFNLFNTPQFNNPGVAVGSSSFGLISSAGAPITFQRTSRDIQLAAKITF